nr:glutamine synthetase family protein [Phaeacidiphilus oryzae]
MVFESGDHRAREADARTAAARLVAEEVHGVALVWVDNAGLQRVKTVPTARLPEACAWGVGMSPVFDTYLVDDSATRGRHLGGPSGDLRLFPDLDRLTVLAGQPGWAWAPVDRRRQDGLPHPACQRRFAARMVEAAAEAGLELRAGFETEWIVTRGQEGDGGPPFAYPTDGPAYGMHRVTDLSDYLADLLRAFRAQEMTVLQLHPEYSPGQFELSLAPEDPVGAADTAVLVRDTVRAVSARHGLRASFAPVFEPGGVGNGGHLHLSLWQEGRNLSAGGPGRHGLTAEAEAFLAGVLAELPALLAVGAPTPASYLRLVPSHWAGAFSCWGLENREAALRLVTGSTGEEARAANAELKCVDQAANPYLLVGAVIAAGLAGLRGKAELPPEVDGDPAALPEDRRPARLPVSLDESLAAFRGSRVLAEALGEVLHDTVAAVRAAEIELFAGRGPEETAAATRWRY